MYIYLCTLSSYLCRYQSWEFNAGLISLRNSQFNCANYFLL